uniref:Uncharacterized protein n=1 Tax=Tanacetum cinerariifolium TaxID=118510 RepID=A0A699I0Z4_TANCI|nr:hypothetical protein [Tanacetum cinerariifolium]
MGHGLGHDSALGLAHSSFPFNDDEDNSHAEEVSPVKPKKPLKRAAKTNKDDPKEGKEAPKEWTVAEEIELCQNAEMPYFYQNQGRKKSKTSETTSGSTSGGINLNEEADEVGQETQEFRPMGRYRAKAKKKAAGSSSGGSSSFVDLVADKFYNMKQKNGKEGQGTTVLYRLEESGAEYPGGRGSRNCTAEKAETRNLASNA